jgi:V/A-type H+/Na+-transporting ATPase subunit D
VGRAVSPTRLELKRQREALARYERFLPALKRKQQQLQFALQQAETARAALGARLAAAESGFAAYASVLGDPSGAHVRALATPVDVVVVEDNVAGVRVPAFVDAVFAEPAYSLFSTPAWVDRTVSDLRAMGRLRAELEVLDRRRHRLARELRRVLQRVNLFEKVRIPRARDAVRQIRIHLGDEMSAAVGRAKLAKRRLATGPAARGSGSP